MALNSEVHPNVPTSYEEFNKWLTELEEEEWRKWKERRRKFLQSEPTVNQIKVMDLSSVAPEWRSMAESLGVSNVAIEEVNSSIGCASTSCRIMLVKWLNHEKGTGKKERTWDAIATAIWSCVRYWGACQFKEAIEAHHMKQERIYAEIFRKTPTLQEIEELILHYLGEDWHKVGELLGMSPKVMKKIGRKFGSVPTQCSEAMFSKWLNHEEGTGHKERTWGTVLTALEDAGRGDVVISVLDKLMVKHKEEEALKKAPNIKVVKVLVIPHVVRMWFEIGQFLGIIKATLMAIEREARKKVSLRQTRKMFQLWLDGREGTGDEDRSWFVILRVLVDIGRSDIKFEIQGHFDLKTKDSARALSLLYDDTQSSSDDTTFPTSSNPVPTTPQGTDTSLVCSQLNGNVGQVSLHDRIEVVEEVEEDKESTPTHHPPLSNGDHFTWSEPKRRHLEEGLDKRGRFLSDQSAGSRRRQKLKKLNRFPKRFGFDRRQKCLVTFDPCGKSKRRKKKNRRCLSEKSGHSREHPPDQPGFSGQKRSSPSGDLEESEFSEEKNQSNLSKSK